MTMQALILTGHDRGQEFRRWALAAALVVAVHGGLAAAYLLRPAPEAQGAPEAPAIIIDLAPVPVAPASQADLAPGPEMVEAQAAPKPPPQTEPEITEPMPPMDAPAPAEVTLPKPEPKAVEQKPEEKPDEKKVEETKPVEQAMPAPRTTAAPRSEQNTAAAPAAPSPGSAASRAQMAQWRDLVAARLQQNKRYPREAEVRHETGVVTLNFSVDRNGKVLSSRIIKSSGHVSLDDEVLAMLRRAAPLPAFGPAMTQSAIQLTVPIQFSLR